MFISDASRLLVSIERNPLGMIEKVHYSWSGSSPYMYVSWRFLGALVGIGGETREIQIGPYKLLQVEHDYEINAVLYVRADRLGSLRVLWYRVTREIDLIYRRSLITLAVWNLAEYSDSTLPVWQNIYFLKRLSDAIKKARDRRLRK